MAIVACIVISELVNFDEGRTLSIISRDDVRHGTRLYNSGDVHGRQQVDFSVCTVSVI